MIQSHCIFPDSILMKIKFLEDDLVKKNMKENLKKNLKNTELRGKFNRKVPNHVAISNDKTHQTNGQQQ